MTYLINLGMKNNGKLIHKGGEKANSWVYEHAIATYALGRGHTFCKQLGVNVPNLEEVTQKAGQYIIDNQHKSRRLGLPVLRGQRPRRRPLGDRLAHPGAQGLQPHRARLPQHALLHPQGRSSTSRAARLQRRLRLHRQRRRQNGDWHTLTGAGMLCLQMWDKGSDSVVRKGCQVHRQEHQVQLGRHRPRDLYGHYYDSQAMMNRGGEEWKKYNKNSSATSCSTNQNADGSWKAPGKARPRRQQTSTTAPASAP